jgi:hypothetical protein
MKMGIEARGASCKASFVTVCLLNEGLLSNAKIGGNGK